MLDIPMVFFSFNLPIASAGLSPGERDSYVFYVKRCSEAGEKNK